MDLLGKALEDYVLAHSTPETPLLHRISRETHLTVPMPNMLSGHLQGMVLAAFSWMMRPKAVLEIGTYTGYSGICLAGGLTEGGVLHTIDINDELAGRVESYFMQAGIGQKTVQHVGNAADIIPGLTETFDLVFIDAYKKNYALYYDLVMDKVRQGGFILADNVLWSGKVADSSVSDADTTAIRAFNKKVQDDPRVENFILPVRDGIMLARKL